MSRIFANRLKELRNERHLSQQELADKLEMPRSTYGGYETEGKEPNIDTLCILANFFGVSTDYLM